MRARKAAALSYSTSDAAPRIAAAGRGRDAERIIRLAEEAGVPIVADAALAELLAPLDFGTLVPEEYWEAVANVLAFVMELEDGK